MCVKYVKNVLKIKIMHLLEKKKKIAKYIK